MVTTANEIFLLGAFFGAMAEGLTIIFYLMSTEWKHRAKELREKLKT